MLAALMLILLAGLMNGSWATPMKRVRGWEWENTWLVWSFLGMIVIPLTIASVTVPNLTAVYGSLGPATLLWTVFYGMLWGASCVLFGLGIARVGLALGFGMILGVGASLGAIVPLVRLHREEILSPAGLLTLAGVGIIFAGVAFCARAGFLREAAGTKQHGQGSFVVGLIICLLSGIGTTFMSVGLNEATPLARAAESFGASHARAMDAVWPILLGGGFVINAGYCCYLFVKQGSAGKFRTATGVNLALVFVMAALWSGSNFVYSAGASGMGPLGLVLGWPIFMAGIVLTANGWGLLTGEWHGAGGRAVAWALGGSGLLVAGISVLASAGGK